MTLAQVGEFSFVLAKVGLDAGLFNGDSYQLFVTINACNDALKSKDDTPSQLPVKL